MKKPQDVRLLVQAYCDMLADEGHPEHAGRWCFAIALLTWVLGEPERACPCGNAECPTVTEIRAMHAEFDEWLDEDRGAYN